MTRTNTDLPEISWQPGRHAALSRLAAFLPNAGRQYAARRNYDLGPYDRSNVSALSPWVRYRGIHETEILSAVMGRYSPTWPVNCAKSDKIVRNLADLLAELEKPSWGAVLFLLSTGEQPAGQ